MKRLHAATIHTQDFKSKKQLSFLTNQIENPYLREAVGTNLRGLWGQVFRLPCITDNILDMFD